MHEVLDRDLGAFLKFARATELAKYRKDVPADVYGAAALTSSMSADCGPCTQLGVGFALASGVPATTVAAIIEGDEKAMSHEVALGARFARAMLARDVSLDALREEITRRWGPRAVLALAFGVMAAQLYPALKYALGHGKACTRVVVAGKAIAPPAPGVGGGVMTAETNEVETFERHRAFLAGLAYRMLGSVAEAEDVVQDAFLRWRDVDRGRITEARPYLARIVSRLCLDRLKSASRRREEYVGTWLPEPVVAEPAESLADDVSVALLLALERLSPLERAAFLLHDVFDLEYAAVAEAIERTEGACRQLVARARENVRRERPRFSADDVAARKLADAFLAAAASGDVAGLAQTLAEDAVLYADGGGKRRAPLHPIVGRERILRFFEGIRASTGGELSVEGAAPASINGLPGFVFRRADTTETLAFEVVGGRILALYAVRNPDKVRHLS